MQIKKLLTAQNIKQFFSYVCVGGVAALVEWGMFTIFSNVLGLSYLLATALAFIISTAVNLILGRIWAFKGNKNYENKRLKETVLIYVVSAVGLGLNLLLMYLFVTVIGWDSDLLKVVSKVLSTGIVFFWNFLIRKFVIYRDKGEANE